jgi:hypothetical protein
MKRCWTLLAVVTAILAQTAACHAVNYVSPKIGGDQVGMMSAPMIMPEIYFDSNSVSVVNASWAAWPAYDWDDPKIPVLRPLTDSNNVFTPGQPYVVLTDKSYNYQYGWDGGLLDETAHPFPGGSVVWVKVLSQTPGLETYYKDGLDDPWYGSAYFPLFGTPGPGGSPSSDKWRWNKGMRHNVYAIPKTFYGRIQATYQVYVGEANGVETINPLTGQPFGSSIVTFNWIRPCPYALTGDLSLDCGVDFGDMAILAAQWADETCVTPGWCDKADMTHSGAVEYTDLTAMATNWLMDCLATPADPQCVKR